MNFTKFFLITFAVSLLNTVNAQILQLEWAKDLRDGCNFTLSLTSTNETLSGANDGVATVTAIGALSPITYNWSNGAITSLNQGLSPGWHVVNVSDSTGCSLTDSVFIDSGIVCNLSLTTNGIDETASGTADGSITSNVLGGFPPYQFNWSNGKISPSISNLTPGTYFVTLTDSIGCQLFNAVTIGTSGCNLSINNTVSHETGVNTNDGTINVFPINGTGPYAYNWSNGQTSSFIDSLAAGVYITTITGGNGCVMVDSITVNPGTCSLSITGSSTDEASPGTNDGTATVTGSNGSQPYSYLWSNGANSSSILSLTTGIYDITVTDNVGCIQITSIIVNSSNCNISVVATSTRESIAGAADGNLSANVLGGTNPIQYSWTNGSTLQNVSGVLGGSYTIIVADANGCLASATTVVTTCNLQITASSFDETSTGANDGSVNVGVTGGSLPYSYLWINTGTSAFIDSLSPGTYTVVVTDSNGCMASDSVSIKPNASNIDELNSSLIELYPNPTKGQVTINGMSEFNRITILNMLGKQVRVFDNSIRVNSMKLNLEDLPSGTYFMKFEVNSKTILSKLIVQ